MGPVQFALVAITSVIAVMNPKHKIEDANHELGCACEHFKWKLDNIKDIKEKEWTNSLYKRVEFLFSKLPAKPWPMKGFGEPVVESRFEN